MYVNILKRDLKRKKTMNIILLIFIIIATMFVSSSVNNIIAVSSALDNYFKKADMTDYYVITRKMSSQDNDISEVLDKADSVKNYRREHVTYINADQISSDSLEVTSLTVFLPITDAKLNYFDINNEKITNVKKGEIYVTQATLEKSNAKPGDIVEISTGDTTVKLKIAGGYKDAFFGSDMMGMTRMLLSEEDYSLFDFEDQAGNLFYINTYDVKKLEKQLSDANCNSVFQGDKNLISLSYIMNMIIAGTLLIVSVCLILISFVVLKFTINYTIDEEYREIGVMKAIGIRDVKIRGIYLVKYFFLALSGAVIGLFAGIPFGSMLLKSVSSSIVMENSSKYLINILCAVLVIGVIMLFCFTCTAKLKKLTPVDAVRNGSQGQRYRKKNIISLNSSKLSSSVFMALSDVLSEIKSYIIMMITFVIGFILIAVILNTMNTLRSDKLVTWFSLTPSDVYMINESERMSYFTSDGHENIKIRTDEIEKELADNGIPARCYVESFLNMTAIYGDTKCSSNVYQGTGTTADEYIYTEGTPPQNEHEAAITRITSKKLGVSIGDKITLSHLNGDREYIITGFFQTMNNMGDGIRIHENDDTDYEQLMGTMDFQIKYTDNPDNDQKEERYEKIKELFTDYTVKDGKEFINAQIGGIAGSMEGIRMIITIIVLTICALVAILMERSFIARQTGEIATMKAIGFRDSVIVKIHTLRMGIVLVIGTIAGILLSTPVSVITTGQVFQMMGAEFIEFDVNKLEVFVACPLLLITVTLIAVFLTSQYTRKILASQTANIE